VSCAHCRGVVGRCAWPRMLLICAYEWCAWVVLTRGGGPQKPIGMRLTEVEGTGLFVSELEPDGNACAAGIRVGDRVIKTSCAPGFQSVRLP